MLIVGSEGWLGNYDFGYLCMPTLPFGKGKGRRQPPPFFSLNADLPLLLALVCGQYLCVIVRGDLLTIVGFQHSLAMLAGVITVSRT